MEALDLWDQKITKSEEDSSITNTIWQVEYSPDYSYLFAVTGNAMIIFDSQTGELCKSNVGIHQTNIYAISISRDGKLIATGGPAPVGLDHTPDLSRADNTVILWNGINIEAQKKFKMSGSIQTLCFNPITNLLFVGTDKDVGLYDSTQTQKKLQRNASRTKVKHGDWSPDGRFVAYGTHSGVVCIMDSSFEEKKKFVKLAPVTAVAWSPLTMDHPDLLLAVACVDQTLSFHDEEGEQYGFERKCKLEIYSLSWFSSGNYFVASGSNNLVSVYSREGMLLKDLVEANDWVWGISVDSHNNRLAIGTNDGEVRSYALDLKEPQAFSHDKFAVRKGLTEVLITDVNTDKKGRFRCKELVRHISLFKNLLAVELTHRILVYEETPQIESKPGTNKKQMGFSYGNIGKFSKKLNSTFFILAAENFISVKENKVKCFDFGERLTMEWTLDSDVAVVKLLPGLPRSESLLVGTKIGKVSRIMLNNPFPTLLINHDVHVMSLDISLMKRYLGIVDIKKGFYLYDIPQKKAIVTEIKIEHCSFNSEFEEMYAFGGEGLVFIKTIDYSGVSMKLKGRIVGFKGSKLKMVNGSNVNTVDIPLSSFMSHFISKKQFKMAYKIASLGVPDQDMRALGLTALKNKEFTIAKKAFTRVKDVGYLNLAAKYEAMLGSEDFDNIQLVVDILSYEKKFKKAIDFLKKRDNTEKAIELCITMKKWNQALALVRQAKRAGKLNNSKYDIYNLLKMQAEGEQAKGNWRAAVDLLVNSNEHTRAIEILIKYDQEEEVINHMRRLNKKQDSQILRACADYFKGKGNHQAGKEALLKLGNKQELMKLHIELEKWDEALLLSEGDPDLRALMLLPYAEFLAKNNRFEEAQIYYKEAGRIDMSMQIMEKLSVINIIQHKFRDSAHFFWILAKETLKNYPPIKLDDEVERQKMVTQFQNYMLKAEIYLAYNMIVEYINRPVNSEKYPGYIRAVMNAARTIQGYSTSMKLEHVSLSKVNYALSKTALTLGIKKLSRVAYEKLNELVVPTDWMEEIELESLKSRAGTINNANLNWRCPRCGTRHVICPDNVCPNCQHPVIISPLSFSEVPVVEFEVIGETDHDKIIEYLTNEDAAAATRTRTKRKRNKNSKRMWDFNMEQNGTENGETEDTETGHIDVDEEREQDNDTGVEEDTPFYDKVTQAIDLQMGQKEYVPVKVDIETLWSMDVDDVFFIDYRKYNRNFPVRYFKKMNHDQDLIICKDCGKMFIADEFDLHYNQHGCCPFCKNKNLSF